MAERHRIAGSLGGIATSLKFGVESLRCPTCGRLPEKSEFHVENGRKGGLKGGRKGAAKAHNLYSREQYAEWGRRGGRPRSS